MFCFDGVPNILLLLVDVIILLLLFVTNLVFVFSQNLLNNPVEAIQILGCTINMLIRYKLSRFVVLILTIGMKHDLI